jgi:hypothetical protein
MAEVAAVPPALQEANPPAELVATAAKVGPARACPRLPAVMADRADTRRRERERRQPPTAAAVMVAKVQQERRRPAQAREMAALWEIGGCLVAARRPAPKEPPAHRPAPKEPPAHRPAPKEPPARRPAPKEPPARRPAPKEPPARRPAPKEPSARSRAPRVSWARHLAHQRAQEGSLMADSALLGPAGFPARHR